MINLHYARLVLDVRRLRDLHEIHEALWAAYPGHVTSRRHGDGPRPERVYLWRSDRLEPKVGEKPKLVVLVQSVITGDWKLLGSRLLECTERVRQFHFQHGDRYDFLLRAVPTRAVKPGVERGQLDREAWKAIESVRVPIFGASDRTDWLKRKAAGDTESENHPEVRGCGFEIATHQASNGMGGTMPVDSLVQKNRRTWYWTAEQLHDHKVDGEWVDGMRKTVTVTYESIDFLGQLVVTDPLKLQAALVEGIGVAKAFGLGMLSLGPKK